jgi:NAD+ diphosphatase
MSIPVRTPTDPPFTGMPLDRATEERKDPARVARLLADSRARTVLAGSEGVVVGGGDPPSLLRAARVLPGSVDDVILLGLEDDAPLFAGDLDAPSAGERAALVEEGSGRVISLREAGALLSHGEAGLAAYLTALLNWHRRHRFCANCGAGTAIAEAGYSRHCPRCGASHFPRTDPCVIMTVEHEGRLLMGRRAGWPAGRLSVLAGFVSPGESVEEAVVREVYEESGIVAHDPVFISSQPWPFPASLMLGFHAEAEAGEPESRDGELEEVRWFSVDAVRDGLNGCNAELLLPPGVSIARLLIERWVALRGT